MKTSIDLPDDLYRRVKSKSALEGRSVREVATALFAAWVEGRAPEFGTDVTATGAGSATPKAGQEWLARWRALGAEVSTAAAGSSGLVDELTRERR